MKRTDFHYKLPDELIARYPLAQRTSSRLLCVDGANQNITHTKFTDLLEQLRPQDLLVFNNTRVIPARLWGQKASGGKIEVLVERLLTEDECLAHVRASKSPKSGAELWLYDDVETEDVETKNVQAKLEVLGRQSELFHLRVLGEENLLLILERIGHMPLPPYIDRADEELDQDRYQTVYGERDGAVAAPTAGLHFDEAFIEQCRNKGVHIGYVTLHVGAGTFQPVRVDDIEDHHMHAEYLEVSTKLCAQVSATKAAGGRVVAVGTTAVRSLETAAQSGHLEPFSGDSQIFIFPGYQFQVVDALLTNFHLPESTLIMLVSAFAGHDFIMRAYAEAVAQQYRFFSYGDAMFVLPDG